MHRETIDYFDKYIAELAKVSTESQVYGQLSDWHVETRPILLRAVQDINRCFGLANGQQLQPHIATTAVGQLHRAIVVVSANPGHSNRPVAGNPGAASKNAMEDAHRSASKEWNARFCQRFFEHYRQVCGGSSPYWTRVMRFLAVYNRQARVADNRALWAETSRTGGLGGLDLLPMHSTSDGITPYLHGPRTDPLLRNVALATLAMAVRLAPRFLLVTSDPGQALMTDLLEREDASGPLAGATIVRRANDAAAPFHRIRAWDVRVESGAATTIVTFPYQRFSGNFSFIAKRIAYSDEGFAAALRGLAAPAG